MSGSNVLKRQHSAAATTSDDSKTDRSDSAKISKLATNTMGDPPKKPTTSSAAHPHPTPPRGPLFCPLLLPPTTSSSSSSSFPLTSPYPIVDVHSEDEDEDFNSLGNSGGIRFGEYQLIVDGSSASSTSASGSGLLSCQAYHIPTGTPVRCQIMSAKEYEHFENVKNRLTMTTGDVVVPEGGGHSHFQYDEDEMDEENRIINAIIPKDIEIIRNPYCLNNNNNNEQQQQQQEYILFSPQNYASLRDLIQKKKCLPEEKARPLFHQIVKIVAFCHSRGIIVRDLKLGKFIFTDPAQTLLGLISTNDLTLCDVDSDSDAIHFRQWCPAFVSPEILDLNRSSCSGKAADVWSMGVLLFVMLFGRYPFYHTSPLGLFQRIRACQWTIYGHERCRYETRLLLQCLLAPCPSKRPSGAELLRSGWFTRKSSMGRKFSDNPHPYYQPLLLVQQTEEEDTEEEEEEEDVQSHHSISNNIRMLHPRQTIPNNNVVHDTTPFPLENQTVPNIIMI